MKQVIAYRFSSFGDVLLTIPVILSFLEENSDAELIFFTRSKFAPYFPSHKRLFVYALDLEKNYSGIRGLFKLFIRIKRELSPSSLIIDFHSVLRTFILNTLFSLNGYKVFSLKKTRKLRKDFLNGTNRLPLPGVLELYKEIFSRAGYHFKLSSPPFYRDLSIPKKSTLEINNSGKIKIGLSPFSMHKTKTWPLENIFSLIDILDQRIEAEYYFFGSENEKALLKAIPNTKITIPPDTIDPEYEIELIASLNILVSMDSANMHLGDILGLTVISIWGGTHPAMGFKPSFQKNDNCISSQLSLDCRPCSVYGQEKCLLKNNQFLCLSSISPQQVAEKVLKELS